MDIDVYPKNEFPLYSKKERKMPTKQIVLNGDCNKFKLLSIFAKFNMGAWDIFTSRFSDEECRVMDLPIEYENHLFMCVSFYYEKESDLDELEETIDNFFTSKERSKDHPLFTYFYGYKNC